MDSPTFSELGAAESASAASHAGEADTIQVKVEAKRRYRQPPAPAHPGTDAGSGLTPGATGTTGVVVHPPGSPGDDDTGRRIGRYHLRERLASGGMGVVYDAYDEQLERRVAIKHLRPEDAADPLRRRRFRREARAAAKLNHPTVVQIHDIVESPEGDWIVMEYVEGRTLAQLMRQGPLGLRRILRLAWEIADGLAEAHDKGVLHRDLKADNVIVTPAGHAKILDFGLAKLYWPQLAEDRLSLTGVVVGTSRAMSPEQANGEELDPRSDLFSLGSLLFEALTGVSPFLAATNLETIDRVCHYQPPPANHFNPEVPVALSALVDQLLEKDRARRPRSARDVAERIAAIAAPRPQDGEGLWTPEEQGLARDGGPPAVAPGGDEVTTTLELHPQPGAVPVPALGEVPHARRPWWPLLVVLAAVVSSIALWYLRPPDEPLYVAVLAPEVGLGPQQTDVARVAAAVRAVLAEGLGSLRGVVARGTEGGPETRSPLTAAQMLDADEVLASRLDCRREICHLSLYRYRGSDARLMWDKSFEVPTQDLDELTRITLRNLYAGFPDHPPQGNDPRLAASSGAGKPPP